MKQKIRLVATGACLSALVAIADDKTFGDGLIPAFLKQYDVNDDGFIDGGFKRLAQRGVVRKRCHLGFDSRDICVGDD